MAIIPIQNKYPDRAGYLGLDTDRNVLSVMSDGKMKSISIPEGWINVKDFGAKGDGVTDDTEAIQKAVNAGTVIFFPEAYYLISHSIIIGDCDTKIIYGNNSTIKLLNTEEILGDKPKNNRVPMIWIKPENNINNVYIYDLKLIGDKIENPVTTEWNHGIFININTQKVTLTNLDISLCRGDGIDIESAGNALINNCYIHENHRNNISLISYENIYIKNSTLEHAEGTSPEAGIGVEPNFDNQHAKYLVIDNCLIKNNNGYGFYINLSKKNSTPENIKVNITNSIFIDNGSSIQINHLYNNLTANINIYNNIIKNNQIIIANSNAKGYIQIQKNQIYDWSLINDYTAPAISITITPPSMDLVGPLVPIYILNNYFSNPYNNYIYRVKDPRDEEYPIYIKEMGNIVEYYKKIDHLNYTKLQNGSIANFNLNNYSFIQSQEELSQTPREIPLIEKPKELLIFSTYNNKTVSYYLYKDTEWHIIPINLNDYEIQNTKIIIDEGIPKEYIEDTTPRNPLRSYLFLNNDYTFKNLFLNNVNNERPQQPEKGYHMFDTNINKAIWYNGTNWVDAQGTTV